MRVFLILTAVFMSMLIGLQFIGDPTPARPFEDMTVVLMSTDDPQNDIQRILNEAINAAQDRLGCDILLSPTRWDDAATVNEIRRLVSALPAGICLMGYPAPTALLTELEDGREQEIMFTSYHSRFPDAEQLLATEGFGYAGVDGYRVGHELATASVVKHGLGPGDVAMLLGDLEHPARTDFRDGCVAAFEAAGVVVDQRIMTSLDLSEARQPMAAELAAMKESGTLPSVLCCSETPIYMANYLLEDAEIEPGSLPLIGMGLELLADLSLMDSAAKGGHISLLASPDIQLDAYLAILQVCMSSSFGADGVVIHTPFRIIEPGDDMRESEFQSSADRFVQVN